MIKLIACIDTHFGIGKDGKMPWPRLLYDMRYFKEKTQFHTIVFGRKTFEEIGNLPNRITIVYRGQKQEVLDFSIDKDIWICGGQRVYEDFIPHADEVHLTRLLNKSYHCDTFFPEFNPLRGSWSLNPVGFYVENGITYSIDVFKRV